MTRLYTMLYSEMVDQVTEIVKRMKDAQDIDIDTDWKVLTLLIGGNDMCGYCDNRVSFPITVPNWKEKQR